MPNVEIHAVMLESRAAMVRDKSRLASADTLGAVHGGADQKSHAFYSSQPMCGLALNG